MQEEARFGVYGFPENFLTSSLAKKRYHIFAWLNEKNLQAIELEWTYGINMNQKRAQKYYEESVTHAIKIILHAPKDIDFIHSSKRERSIHQLERAYRLAVQLHCHDVVVSLGSSVKMCSTEEIKQDLVTILQTLQQKYPDIRIHLEPAMRKSEFGNLIELLDIASRVDRVYPCMDLPRLHVWNGCNLIYPERIMQLFRQVEQRLGKKALSNLIVHICPIAYEGGKIYPKTFGELKLGQLSLFDSNVEYFPKASDYAKAILRLQITPTTISCTTGSVEVGAKRLRDSYFYQQPFVKK